MEVTWDDGTQIIVDAGTGLRALGQKMIKYKQVNKFSMILTHMHWDHIMGFPFYPPFYQFPVTCSIVGHLGASSRIKRLLSLYAREIYSPLNQTRFKTTLNFEDLPEKEWTYGEHLVRHHQQEHPGGSLGLRFMGETADAVFCTDNELGLLAKKKKKYASLVKFVSGAKTLIHDANYTEQEYKARSGWGHSTVSQVVRLAQEAGVAKVYLTHHDPDRTDDEVREMMEYGRSLIPSGSELECEALAEGEGLLL